MSYTIYDTSGVVTSSWPYKDASRRLMVYSRDIGRILVRAQAVRKLDSKLGSAVQQYSESKLALVYGQSGWRLVGADPRRNFLLSAQSLPARQAIRKTTNLVTRLVPAQKPDSRLYSVITAGLSALQSAEQENQVALTEKLFVFRLLARLGYAPDPSAKSLQQFLGSQTYRADVLADFDDSKQQATTQINQALRNVQL